MPFEWIEYLTYARNIQHSDDEATVRSCVSRAYYAAFGLAAQRLDFYRIQVPRGVSKHMYVWWYYDRDVVRGGSQTILKLSSDLKRKRVGVDYEESFSIRTGKQGTGEEAIFLSERLIESITDLTSNVQQRSLAEWQRYYDTKKYSE